LHYSNSHALSLLRAPLTHEWHDVSRVIRPGIQNIAFGLSEPLRHGNCPIIFDADRSHVSRRHGTRRIVQLPSHSGSSIDENFGALASDLTRWRSHDDERIGWCRRSWVAFGQAECMLRQPRRRIGRAALIEANTCKPAYLQCNKPTVCDHNLIAKRRLHQGHPF
jgi:hypothetical protein